jgi:hypothetical protein
MDTIQATPELKAKRIEICQEMLEVPEKLGPQQKIMRLQGMNAVFTVIILSADNGQQIMRRYILEFVPQFHRKRG